MTHDDCERLRRLALELTADIYAVWRRCGGGEPRVTAQHLREQLAATPGCPSALALKDTAAQTQAVSHQLARLCAEGSLSARKARVGGKPAWCYAPAGAAQPDGLTTCLSCGHRFSGCHGGDLFCCLSCREAGDQDTNEG